MNHSLQIKRAYLPPEASDGIRILIDRLWPRGIKKEEAAIDEWCKAATPSHELRKWFGHKEENFHTFRQKYIEELNANPEASDFAIHCLDLLKENNVTLIYGARSTTCNHAVILREWLEKFIQR